MNTRSSVVGDFLYVIVLAFGSLLIGLGINRFRSTPLPLVYQSPEQRLSAELAHLVAAPPMQLNGSDSIGFNKFRTIFQSGSALIVDARDKTFYDQGHIPGALSLPRDDFPSSYKALRPTLDQHRDQPIVVYCSGGDCHDSRLVAGALLSLGYSQVQVFTDGWQGWTDNGMPEAH
ncbi:MAG TPA: rhodanese-like domain-containing protein [Candidatus Binataceae bacterium]|nr:rhodanese-like domain-containing protein [Candidatus Binataceae bacterium]